MSKGSLRYRVIYANKVNQLNVKQACYLSVTTQLPGAKGYTGGKVIFIDTENTLYPFWWIPEFSNNAEIIMACIWASYKG